MSVLVKCKSECRCHGCESIIRIGHDKWMVQSRTQNGHALAVRLCTDCKNMVESPGFDALDWLVTVSCRTDMKKYYKHIFELSSTALARSAMDEMKVGFKNKRAVSAWYWRRYDAAIALIPGPLAEV